MSQADMEKAYTEAVDQLARAVEANRLLTDRLERMEIEIAQVRTCIDEVDGIARSTTRGGLLGQIRQTVRELDPRPRSSHIQEPPARPGEPT